MRAKIENFMLSQKYGDRKKQDAAGIKMQKTKHRQSAHQKNVAALSRMCACTVRVGK